MKKNLRIILIVILALVVGFAVEYFVNGFITPAPPVVAMPQEPSPTPMVQAISTSTTGYGLLNGDVAWQSGQHFIVNFEPLRSQIASITQEYPQNTYIYFDYLNSSANFGTNARTLFTAASTVKVPLAMAVYKMAEEGKLNMNSDYTLQQSDLDSNFGTLYKAGAGATYTIQQLVSIMLEQSDNTAMNALLSALNNIGVSDPFADVYQQMGWNNFPTIGQVTDYKNYINIDVHTLSNMFLALYSASYDSPTDSQAILSYLTQTLFSNEIVAGVASSTIVAHKIGTAADNLTYSDCGIVYAPSRPYILCVGSSGASEQSADQYMSQVSKATYQYVINN